MNTMTLRPLLIGLSTAIVLAACGSESPDSHVSTNAANSSTPAQDAPKSAATKTSNLDAFAGPDICKILSKKALTSLFSPQSEVETHSRVNKRGASCTWNWPRPDAEERRQAMVTAMMERMKSGAKKKPKLSAYSMNYEIRVELQDSHATAQNFVPRKLSESELQAQIAEVDKRTRERLTDKQKKVAEKAGISGMAGRLLRKANQREVVDGIGEAAYWTPVGNGSLRVLIGDKAMVISPSITDDKQGNLDVARKIYATITQ